MSNAAAKKYLKQVEELNRQHKKRLYRIDLYYKIGNVLIGLLVLAVIFAPFGPAIMVNFHNFYASFMDIL